MFICAVCGGEFPSDPEGAKAEAEAVFGAPVPTDPAASVSVCTACYDRVMTWAVSRDIPLQWDEPK
jgi:hypothetical protein